MCAGCAGGLSYKSPIENFASPQVDFAGYREAAAFGVVSTDIEKVETAETLLYILSEELEKDRASIAGFAGVKLQLINKDETCLFEDTRDLLDAASRLSYRSVLIIKAKLYDSEDVPVPPRVYQRQYHTPGFYYGWRHFGLSYHHTWTESEYVPGHYVLLNVVELSLELWDVDERELVWFSAGQYQSFELSKSEVAAKLIDTLLEKLPRALK